jgi:hypothetical protein
MILPFHGPLSGQTGIDRSHDGHHELPSDIWKRRMSRCDSTALGTERFALAIARSDPPRDRYERVTLLYASNGSDPRSRRGTTFFDLAQPDEAAATAMTSLLFWRRGFVPWWRHVTKHRTTTHQDHKGSGGGSGLYFEAGVFRDLVSA